jgi:hypothetical protein
MELDVELLLFQRICGEDWRFALGWNEEKVLKRVREITSFAFLNSRWVIGLDRRRRIIRLADDLLTELKGLGGLPDGFDDTLRQLAGPKSEWRRSHRGQPKRGGDRRSGEKSLGGMILEMTVWLCCEAHEKPGFSENGLLVRFANEVGKRALFVEEDPFTSNAVKACFRRIKPKVKPSRGLQYRVTPVVGEGSG